MFLPTDQRYPLKYCLFADQLPCYIEHFLFFVTDFWLSVNCLTIMTKMNCGLLGDQHQRSPCQRICCLLALELLSKVRIDFLEVWYVSKRYAEIGRTLRVVLVVDIQIFSSKCPCTFLKTLILVRVCSSEFPRKFAHFGVCEPHLRT